MEGVRSGEAEVGGRKEEKENGLGNLSMLTAGGTM